MNKEAQAMIEAIQQNELEAAVQLFKQSVEQSVLENNSADSVSYTHLTLPTSDLV